MTKIILDTLQDRNSVGSSIKIILKNLISEARIISPYFSATENYIDFSKISNVKIICDLQNSSCNPYTMQKLSELSNVNVKFRNDIHAKLYIFDNKIIIGSANPTPNGLGRGTLEAAVEIDCESHPNSECNIWFDELWSHKETYSAKDLNELDWERLKKNWDVFPSRDLTGIPGEKSIQDSLCTKLFTIWTTNENIIEDYMFGFYFSLRESKINKEKIAKKYQLDYFEEATYATKKEALAESEKIKNSLGIKNGERIIFCINVVNSKQPKKGKFKLKGAFVGVFKDVVCEEDEDGVFNVLSLYEEIKYPSVMIDEDFIEYISSCYLDKINHPNFQLFMDETLSEMNYFCTPVDLRNGLKK